MVAITNTTLVAVVTQSRILYGMAREDVVPGVFGKIHASAAARGSRLIFALLRGRRPAGRRHAPRRHRRHRRGGPAGHRDRGLPLFIYALVIVSALKLRGHDEHEDTLPRQHPAALRRLLGNAVLLVYVVVDDPTSLSGCAGLLALGVVLFLVEYFFGRRDRAPAASAATRLDRQQGGLNMHVIVATDGSKQSLAAARHLKSFADPAKITDISVVAVLRPLAAVAFADDLADPTKAGGRRCRFRAAAEGAVAAVAATFDGWGPEGAQEGAQRLAGQGDHQGGRGGRCRAGRGRQRRSRAQRLGAGRQHRPAGAALRTLPGARRPPGPAQAAAGDGGQVAAAGYRSCAMETLRLVLLFVHILGFAALLGGLLVQARTPEKMVNAPCATGRHGVRRRAALVGVLEAGDDDVNHAKIAVKSRSAWSSWCW